MDHVQRPAVILQPALGPVADFERELLLHGVLPVLRVGGVAQHLHAVAGHRRDLLADEGARVALHVLEVLGQLLAHLLQRAGLVEAERVGLDGRGDLPELRGDGRELYSPSS